MAPVVYSIVPQRFVQCFDMEPVFQVVQYVDCIHVASEILLAISPA